MPKISLVIITFNEEKNIERCLKSAQIIADEIIVIDSFSTDRTTEICRNYYAKIFKKEWMGYSKQKNFGIEQASHDTILSLDADEELSKELLKSIIKLKQDEIIGAYSFNRLNNYCGKWIKHTSWYPDKKLRIWNRKDGLWEGEIHEKVILNNSIAQKNLKGDLLHYSYYSIDEHIAQANKFSTISAETKFENNERATIFKITISPAFKFIKEYFIKKGFLDGVHGFAISIISSHETFLKYLKLYILQHNAV